MSRLSFSLVFPIFIEFKKTSYKTTKKHNKKKTVIQTNL